MKKNLYEITDELRTLIGLIEEAEGEITPEIGDALAIAEDEYEKKIMAYYGVIQEKKGKNSVIKDELERLNNLAASNTKLIDKLTSMVLGAVQEFGYDGKSGNKKLDLDTLKLWTVNRDKVEFFDENKFDDPRFCHVSMNVPSDRDTIDKVFRYLVSISDDKELVFELNSDLKVTISRKRLKDALSLGTKVKGASLVSNTYVVMR